MKKYKRLKKGEVECNKCEGTGSIIKHNNSMIDMKWISYDMMKPCPKCKGEGKLDWVENVVGKGLTTEEKYNREMKKFLKNNKLHIVTGSQPKRKK